MPHTKPFASEPGARAPQNSVPSGLRTPQKLSEPICPNVSRRFTSRMKRGPRWPATAREGVTRGSRSPGQSFQKMPLTDTQPDYVSTASTKAGAQANCVRGLFAFILIPNRSVHLSLTETSLSNWRVLRPSQSRLDSRGPRGRPGAPSLQRCLNIVFGSSSNLTRGSDTKRLFSLFFNF